ncbi:MAG: electron transfer flavoprotein subunit alpha/FixB family protein [Bacteroidetes bacterium]|nr:MAG: electron transfer flavoprotein subunit alpha/FixB family protein [Bacteroidota bacterium]
MAVIVFAENKNGAYTKASQEAVYYGSQIAAKNGDSVIAVTFGNIENPESIGNFGANKIIVHRGVDIIDSQKLSKLVVNAANEHNGDIIVFSYDFTGKTVAPRVSAALKAGLVAGAVDYPDTSNGFVVKKTVFSGKAFAFVKVNSDKKIIGLLPNSVQVQRSDATAEVSEVSYDLGETKYKVKEFKKKGGEGIPLPEAEIVVSGGRGLKGPENWGMIEELAKVLGAATACSRPVADMGWRPHHEHVGQTGITIRPNLYIAIGISGAIQHLAGVNQSKTIVVINTDPEAPFFKAADYCIVGDAFEVVPKLIEAIKKFKASQN